MVAVAYDAAGNVGSSAPVAVNVANGSATVIKDTVAPTVSIDNPVASGSVSGSVSVSVSAADNAGAAGISTSLEIDGSVKASGKGGSLAYNWNTRKVSKSVHSIRVTARDAAGNSTIQTISVTVR